jgi:hypothetical protein
MGFYPFQWTWRTRSGGQVKLFGVFVTIPLLGGSWWWTHHTSATTRSRSLPNENLPLAPDHSREE